MEKGISIFTDGGALGNPGPAASAFVVYEDAKIIHQSAARIGSTTNNVAEYQAVIEALSWLKENLKIFNSQFSILNFYSDSQLIVQQLNGFYKIKDAKLRLLVIRVKSLEQGIKGRIYYQHIPREKNTLADSLVKGALANCIEL